LGSRHIELSMVTSRDVCEYQDKEVFKELDWGGFRVFVSEEGGEKPFG